MTTTIKAYWLNGTAYCADCVECETPCLGEAEIAQATAGNGVGRCGCCGEMFADGDLDQTKPVLYRYDDSSAVRNATAEELAASKAAAETDGGAGVIEVNGVDCYVQE